MAGQNHMKSNEPRFKLKRGVPMRAVENREACGDSSTMLGAVPVMRVCLVDARRMEIIAAKEFVLN